MTDRDQVIAGLTMLSDSKNDSFCEGLKCCKIAEDAITLIREQETERLDFIETVAKLVAENELLKKDGKANLN